MEHSPADHVRALSALGHEARLEVYRLLVRAGPEGLNIGEIGALTGAPASTLAHHLRALVAARLVSQEKQGREVINRADFETIKQTIAFLTDECCQGVDARPNAAA